MRHRKRGRKLGRNQSHRRAMLRNMASSLLRTFAPDEGDAKVRGRIVTTPAKAKEVQPFIERLITLARNSLVRQRDAEQWESDAARNSSEWQQWRNSERWQQWSQARAPLVAARQRALSLLRDKHAVQILFDEVAPRYFDRPGGYTRIIRLAQRRLGDAGATAILELVEEKMRSSARPSPVVEPVVEAAPRAEPVADETGAEETASSEPSEEDAGAEATASAEPEHSPEPESSEDAGKSN